MKKVLIHQPEYIPWVNFFLRLKNCDIFVILDDVQFSRRSFQNRNVIINNNKQIYLTVPVKKSIINTKINEIKIDYSTNWIEKHLRSLELSYKKSKFFNYIYDDFAKILNLKFEHLSELNITILKHLIKKLELNCEICLNSTFSFNSKKSDLILEICKQVEASEYITGEGSKNYLKNENFKKNKIDIKFINNKFKYNLSIIDYLFKHGYNF